MEGANGLPVVRGELVIGYTPREVTKEEEARSDEQSARWAEDVRNAMRHAWSGYRTYAWGRDELKPQSKVGADPWGGIGCTLVDALDTLWLMGLRSEFEEAARWAKEKLTFAHAGTVSTFETTIRELGGLLAAHDLSGDAGLLARAEEIGSKLVRAFAGGAMTSGQVGLRCFLERGPKSLNQLMREMTNKAHGVGHDRLTVIRKVDLTQSRVERRE